MKPEVLKAKLAKCNLSELSRLSGVPVRTLRRLVNEDRTPRTETIERLVPYLKEARR